MDYMWICELLAPHYTCCIIIFVNGNLCFVIRLWVSWQKPEHSVTANVYVARIAIAVNAIPSNFSLQTDYSEWLNWLVVHMDQIEYQINAVTFTWQTCPCNNIIELQCVPRSRYRNKFHYQVDFGDCWNHIAEDKDKEFSIQTILPNLQMNLLCIDWIASNECQMECRMANAEKFNNKIHFAFGMLLWHGDAIKIKTFHFMFVFRPFEYTMFSPDLPSIAIVQHTSITIY